MVNTAYLLLGSNLENRKNNLEKAVVHLAELAGQVTCKSSLYETLPWGVTDQPRYWNQVVILETALAPQSLLQVIHHIERQMGRERRTRYEARIIDIDILYFNTLILQTESLIIPHPQIAYRRFTLVPLAEIAPGFVHPVLQTSNQVLLASCADNLEVVKLEKLD